MLVIIFIPWLLWGFSISTERLRDRDKSAWSIAVLYGLPAVLGQIAKAAWFAGTAGTVLHYILSLAAFALTIWGSVESASSAAAPGRTDTAPTRWCEPNARASTFKYGQRSKRKKPDGHQATERIGSSRECRFCGLRIWIPSPAETVRNSNQPRASF
jgi:hypothetical protein